jgi:site-specific DNA recombinase
MTRKPTPKVRCAVYTRKSSEEGLDMEFNSLDAQRESCEAYITSQRQEGWLLIPNHYDDGGISGATLERPGLQRLLRDVEDGRIDVVVVYKVDRLSRSLADFARIIDMFEKHGVSFISITQQFNTTSSMGRLTLNILLSFAQFEREVIGERIRDKFAASRRKGMWMGGSPPLGYDVENRKLIVNKAEAALVRHIFERFVRLGSATVLVAELKAEGHRTKTWTTQKGRVREGNKIDKGFLYKLFRNRVYLGEAVHKGESFPGEHHAIIDRPLWDKVHAILAENPKTRSNRTRATTPMPLKGLIRCGHCDAAMTPSHTRRRGKLYRYYLCLSASKNGHHTCPVRSIAAGEAEAAVIDNLRALVRAPELVVRTWCAVNKAGEEIPERDVRDALGRLDEVWDELFPAEQARLLRLMVNKVALMSDGLDIQFRGDGLNTVIEDLRAIDHDHERRTA